MKVKTAVLSTVIVAVLAAMEVKAAEGTLWSRRRMEPDEVSIPIHDEQRSYFANLMSRMPSIGMRMPRMPRMSTKFKLAVAGILLIASYELVNYLIDVPIVVPDVPDAPDVVPLLKFPTTTTTTNDALPITLDVDEFDEFVDAIVPNPDATMRMNVRMRMRYLRMIMRTMRYLRMRMTKKPIEAPLVVSAHAQRTGSKWIAAGLSSLALISIFAMALILWNLKNPKKTGRKEAPFSR